MNTHVHAELPLEEPPCPLCGSGQQRQALPAGRFLPYGIARCTGCAFHFLSPRPCETWGPTLLGGAADFDDELGIEGEPCEEAGDHADRGHEATLRPTFRRLLKALDKRGATGGALLEVGCGLGYFLDEARPFFDRRDGTELSATAALAAGKVSDIVAVGGIEAVPAKAIYDTAISRHVIERVYNPVAFLRAQSDRVVPGGTIVASTPWMGSLWQRALGERWPSFKAPERLHYFDPISLTNAFHRAGLVDVQTVPTLRAFPAASVARKLGFELNGPLGSAPVWIPQTTLAVMGRRPE